MNFTWELITFQMLLKGHVHILYSYIVRVSFMVLMKTYAQHNAALPTKIKGTGENRTSYSDFHQ